ncbi:MAG TPA: O-succinylhomoserine sulfhydrylase [Rhodospirillales bacterium]|nr:O-succinylhomoserine sulfhydrylase [Rhodospirillales bacterium]
MKDDTAAGSWRDATKLIRAGLTRSGFCETSEALFMTSGYVYGSAEEAEEAFSGARSRFVYSRYANPTVQMFEDRLAALEGARFCKGTASGMAAVFGALACQLRAGDRIVASRALFGSCQYVVAEILPAFGVESEFVDGRDLAAWERALSRPAACVFLESPSNPMLEIVDLAEVCRLARAAGACTVIDNVFATPLLQRPFAYGADVVIYSATKHIDGQGRSLGGAVLTNDQDYLENKLIPFLRHTGPALSPFNAWLLLKGLETLELRVTRQCANALALAEHLEGLHGVEQVFYPELPSHPQHALAMRQMTAGGTVLSFTLAGGKAEAFRFLNGLSLIDISNNLGDTKTLATHPPTTTHQRLTPEERAVLGITDATVRVSAGLEHIDDLREDVSRAFTAGAA